MGTDSRRALTEHDYLPDSPNAHIEHDEWQPDKTIAAGRRGRNICEAGDARFALLMPTKGG
ncbi:MAG: hypothetical protein C4335_06500 [Armatimonadota bacterium]